MEADTILAAVEKAQRNEAYFELSEVSARRSTRPLMSCCWSIMATITLILNNIDQLNNVTMKLAENMMNTAVRGALKGTKSDASLTGTKPKTSRWRCMRSSRTWTRLISATPICTMDHGAPGFRGRPQSPPKVSWKPSRWPGWRSGRKTNRSPRSCRFSRLDASLPRASERREA